MASRRKNSIRLKALPVPKPPKPPSGPKPPPGLKRRKGLSGLPGPKSKASPGPVDPSTLEVIQQALTQRRPITVHYDGKHRELSSIALGTKDGELHLWAYQFGGESTYKCKCFVVAKLNMIELMVSEWREPDTDPGPGSCMDDILQRVMGIAL